MRLHRTTLVVFLVYVVVVPTAYALQQSAAEPLAPATSQGQKDLIVTAVIGFLTMIFTQLFAIYRDNKKWERDREERAERRKEADDKIEAVARVATETHRDIKADIAENTKISVDAFKAANDVNAKIAMLAGRFVGDEEESETAAEVKHVAKVLRRVDDTTQETLKEIKK